MNPFVLTVSNSPINVKLKLGVTIVGQWENVQLLQYQMHYLKILMMEHS
jgi:hypothetical protein